jgi:dipeptidyl aminopeptidase/acylaminoacyl peptidase
MLVTGCGDDKPQTAATPSPTATLTPAFPSATPEPELPPGRALRFASSDGKRLRGRLTPAAERPAPAVILVHQYQGGPDRWTPLLPALHRAGFTTLAYGSRNAAELDESKLARDVVGAVAALRDQPAVDGDRIVLVGASRSTPTTSSSTPAARASPVTSRPRPVTASRCSTSLRSSRS